MARMLVIGEAPELLDLLARGLRDLGHEVLTVAHADRTAAQAAAERPDTIVLELPLTVSAGDELIRDLRRETSAPILVLSEPTHEADKVRALDAGADDFLELPFGMPELLARLRALERRATQTPSTLDFPGLSVDLDARHLVADGVETRLTPIEWAILQLLSTRPGLLTTHQQLVAEVWGYAEHAASRPTLRTHLRSLRRKLGDPAANPRFIRTESGVGYRWIAEAADQPTADEEGNSSRPSDSVLHDLNNVVTALRLNAWLSERQGIASADHLAQRWEPLAQRACALVAELHRQ